MARNDSRSTSQLQEWQVRFLKILPRIQQLASVAFRRCETELRQELVAEATGYCYCAYHRLVQLEREHHAHPTTLVRFAVKRVGSGLQIGCSRNRFDVMSRYSRLRSGLRVQSLTGHTTDGGWRELVPESTRASPADMAALRVDFAQWLCTLSQRDREIALLLGAGERTFAVAERFQISSGRVSQLRRSFEKSWLRLHGLNEYGQEIDHSVA
jgi:hypothetical protein